MKENEKNKIDLAAFDIEEHDLNIVETEYTKIQNVFTKVKDDVESLIKEENRHLLEINKELRHTLEKGIRLNRPLLCPLAVFNEIMVPCWRKK